MLNTVLNIAPLNGAIQREEKFKLEFLNGREKIMKSWDMVSYVS